MKPQQITKIIRTNKDILEGLAGTLIDDNTLWHVAKVFCHILNIKAPVKVGLVYQSCLHLIDTTPDAVTIVETFRKVAANDEYIWKGMSIPMWRGEPVRVDVGVVRASDSQGLRSRSTDIYFRVLTGLPAGMLMFINAPSWWVEKIVRRKLGLFRSNVPVTSMDISGTTFSVKLSTKGADNKVVWEDIKSSPKQKEKNKGLINARYNERPCGSSEPCSKCRYTRRQCPLAVL